MFGPSSLLGFYFCDGNRVIQVQVYLVEIETEEEGLSSF